MAAPLPSLHTYLTSLASIIAPVSAAKCSFCLLTFASTSGRAVVQAEGHCGKAWHLSCLIDSLHYDDKGSKGCPLYACSSSCAECAIITTFTGWLHVPHVWKLLQSSLDAATTDDQLITACLDMVKDIKRIGRASNVSNIQQMSDAAFAGTCATIFMRTFGIEPFLWGKMCHLRGVAWENINDDLLNGNRDAELDLLGHLSVEKVTLNIPQLSGRRAVDYRYVLVVNSNDVAGVSHYNISLPVTGARDYLKVFTISPGLFLEFKCVASGWISDVDVDARVEMVTVTGRMGRMVFGFRRNQWLTADKNLIYMETGISELRGAEEEAGMEEGEDEGSEDDSEADSGCNSDMDEDEEEDEDEEGEDEEGEADET